MIDVILNGQSIIVKFLEMVHRPVLNQIELVVFALGKSLRGERAFLLFFLNLLLFSQLLDIFLLFMLEVEASVRVFTHLGGALTPLIGSTRLVSARLIDMRAESTLSEFKHSLLLFYLLPILTLHVFYVEASPDLILVLIVVLTAAGPI